jgi:hypothetical protein
MRNRAAWNGRQRTKISKRILIRLFCLEHQHGEWVQMLYLLVTNTIFLMFCNLGVGQLARGANLVGTKRKSFLSLESEIAFSEFSLPVLLDL